MKNNQVVFLQNDAIILNIKNIHTMSMSSFHNKKDDANYAQVTFKSLRKHRVPRSP